MPNVENSEAPTPAAAPPAIAALVERFERQLEAYKSGHYNETQVRREFIDPFFKALGWDVDNEQGYAEAYKDVIHEDSIRVGRSTKAPDYSFRIGGTRKFFVEAKRPSVNLKDDPSPAYQLRRYGFSNQSRLSILSDFEEFAVYDCRGRPYKDDPASTARVFYCTFRDYDKKWDWIASIFSRDAVLRGSFDKYAESNKLKRGTQEFDESFLSSLETWRADLARNLALRNPRLTQRELNFAVQRIIDRIIFLRICEDRGIEDQGRLQALMNGGRIYPRLCELFDAADTRYNSGLFHFKPEKGRHEPPDELTPSLELDDKLLREILTGLYYPESPYEFSVVRPDILGQVYEQFLGKVIRLTEGHHAVVDDKPEVKKAGGVYYTPTYIVDYIVRQTVGQLVQGKTPKQVEELKILDPACGSGSFLIGAYQFLLDWHRDWYTDHDPAKWAKGATPALVQADGGGWNLATEERKRILLNNIYGVDIDSQAVEVTKLSLLLKVLEGETAQSLQAVLRLFHERALPDLGDNIKCGNSLIGPDFYRQTELPLLTDEERHRINLFDWPAEFPRVFTRETASGNLRETATALLDYTTPGVPLHGAYARGKGKGTKDSPSLTFASPGWSGGFDVVIGNPPYIRIQMMLDTQPQEVAFFSRAYHAAQGGNYDIYVVFVERGLGLLNPNGRLGFILPNKFLNAQYGRSLREILSSGRHLSRLVHFGDQQIFLNATTYTCLLFLTRSAARTCEVVKVRNLRAWRDEGAGESAKLPAASFGASEWNLELGKKAALRVRLAKMGPPLGTMAHIFVGLQTSADRVYVLSDPGGLEPGILKPFLTTGGLQRYAPAARNAWLVFPYAISGGTARLLPPEEVRKTFPKAWAYFVQKRDDLTARERGTVRGEDWYRYVYPKNLCAMEAPKLVIQVTSKEPTVILDTGGLYMTGGGAGPFYGIRPIPATKLGIKYLLGILNSKVFGWIVRTQSTPLRGGYVKFSKQYIETVPIPQPAETMRDRLVGLVEQMLALHQQRAAARTPQEQTSLGRQISATDAVIDHLVYELYGLNDEEIRIVQENT